MTSLARVVQLVLGVLHALLVQLARVLTSLCPTRQRRGGGVRDKSQPSFTRRHTNCTSKLYEGCCRYAMSRARGWLLLLLLPPPPPPPCFRPPRARAPREGRDDCRVTGARHKHAQQRMPEVRATEGIGTSSAHIHWFYVYPWSVVSPPVWHCHCCSHLERPHSHHCHCHCHHHGHGVGCARDHPWGCHRNHSQLAVRRMNRIRQH